MPTTHSNVGGIVLCGGKSSRMGQAKLSLPFGTESMLARVVRILSEVVSPVVVVAAAGQDIPPLPSDVIIARDAQEGLGPLAGIAKGLSMLPPDAAAAYTSGCDVPLLQPDFIRLMIDSLEDHQLVIPRDGKYYHPLAAVYRSELADIAGELVTAGRLRPVFLVDECDSRMIDVEELRKVDPRLDSLQNVNTPEAYEQALSDAGLPHK